MWPTSCAQKAAFLCLRITIALHLPDAAAEASCLSAGHPAPAQSPVLPRLACRAEAWTGGALQSLPMLTRFVHGLWNHPVGLHILILLCTCCVSCSMSACSAAAGLLRMRWCTAAARSAHHFQGRPASGDKAREARRPPSLPNPSIPASITPRVRLQALADQ